jgi:hypothetical protein
MVAEGSAHRHREVFDVCLPVGAQLKELHSVPLLAVWSKREWGVTRPNSEKTGCERVQYEKLITINDDRTSFKRGKEMNH